MSRLNPAPATTAPDDTTLASPLQRLHDLLAPDMEATNALILSRLQSPVDTIPKVAEYLIAAGGKRIRPLLTLACAAMFGHSDHRAHKLATAVEFIHSASLLHDDVVDESDLRRGKQPANFVYGNKAAVLVGDFLFSRAFELMVETDNLRVLHLLSKASATIAEGEVMQLVATGNITATMDDYLKIIGAKTASLFAAAASSGPALFDATKIQQDALYTYGHHLGIAFQIADDVLDYTGDAGTFGKQQGNDFLEGKMTAPVIFALAHAGATEAGFWTRCLMERDVRDGDFATATEYLHQHDAFSKSHHLAEQHRDDAIAALEPLDDHVIKDLLVELVTYAVRRER